MQGHTTLFKNIFEDSATTLVKQRKGRSSILIAQRNECLIDRYYYYGKFMDLRYSAIIRLLSSEFFLSEVTIPEVIAENFSKLSQLKKDQPTAKTFRDKWPHLSWP